MTTEEFVKRWSVWFSLHRDGQKLKEAFEKEIGETNQNNALQESLRILSDLVDLQNGPPLETYRKEWEQTMEEAYQFLGKWKK